MSYIPKRIQYRIHARKKFNKPSNPPRDGSGLPLRVTRLFPLELKPITAHQLLERKQVDQPTCQNQLLSFFDCLEKHEHRNEPCQQFKDELQKCYENFKEIRREVLVDRRNMQGKNRILD